MLDNSLYMLYNVYMEKTEVRKLTAIRLIPSVVHLARIAAVTDQKTLGQWLEEAILEKLEREWKQ